MWYMSQEKFVPKTVENRKQQETLKEFWKTSQRSQVLEDGLNHSKRRSRSGLSRHGWQVQTLRRESKEFVERANEATEGGENFILKKELMKVMKIFKKAQDMIGYVF